MIDKIRKLLDELHAKQNLILRLRKPPACIFCSSDDALSKYNSAYAKSGRFVVEDVSVINDLIIMENKDLISTRCGECGAERVKEKFQLEKFYWVTCGSCNTKQISPVEDMCPLCDDMAKVAKAEFFKKNGG